MSTTTPERSTSPAAADPMEPVKPKILLAEDDREMRRALAWGLRRAGYDVVEFKSGYALTDHLVDALLADPERPIADLIISDIRMPGASGLDILEGVRTLDAALPVVLITAFGSPATHADAADLGAMVLDKPFDLDDLVAVVQKALERKPG